MRNNRSFNPRKRDYVPGRREPRRISASNAVVNAVMQFAAIYRVPAYRMQSRCFTVTGAGGAERPMFMGQWDDMDGGHHFGGMCDVLLTVTIKLRTEMSGAQFYATRVQVPLWCECKSGNARLTPEQIKFRDHVLSTGGFWILCHDSADALVAWFREHEVERP